MNKSDNYPGASLSDQITRDYNIIRLLGKGGMGEVYLAEQLRVGRRPVALKVLNRSYSEDAELRRRFENEAASAGRINHRNVVTVHESRVTDEGQLYVAMEYVEGSDLSSVIEERGALPMAEVAEITRQAAAGLGAAHKLGIVHRDVKPANIMLTRDDDGALVVKVLDFGIARLSEPEQTGSQTKTGVVMGTPDYMSPEQTLGQTGDKIDRRSDIYSLAMVVHHMLTGRVAFQADSWIHVMYKHVHEPPVPPSQIRPDLPYLAAVDQVILKGLEKDRDKRQQSAAEFATDLLQACGSPGTQILASAAPDSSAVTRKIGGSETARGIGATVPASEPIATVATDATGRTVEIGTGSAPTGAPPAVAQPSRRKRVAAVVSAVVILGLSIAAFMVIRGGFARRQQVVPDTHESAAVVSPASTAPPVSTEPAAAIGNNNATRETARKEEPKKEVQADKPGTGEPLANPNKAPAASKTPATAEPSTIVQPAPAQPAATPAPAPQPPSAQTNPEGDTCVGVLVIGKNGEAAAGAQVDITDEISGQQYQKATGPFGKQKFCGLTAGHRVTIRVHGPLGAVIARRVVMLKPGGNPNRFQLQ